MTGHSRFSPSSAHRWSRCAGSIDGPGSSSRYADEGTAAHTLAAEVLLTPGREPHDFMGRWIAVGDDKFEVTDDMADNVAKYTGFCRALISQATMYGVELRADLSEVLGVPGQRGTADFWAVISHNLIVADLKSGRGVEVHAEENEQLMLYAAGVLRVAELALHIDTVTLVVSQPRKQHHDEWTLTVEELRAFVADLAVKAQAIAAAENIDDLPRVAGEKQCLFCTKKPECPTFRKWMTDAFDKDTVSEFDGAEPAIERLPVVLPKLDLIEKWCKSVKNLAHARLAAGEVVEGYKLIEGRRGPRQWLDATKVEAKLKALRVKRDDMYTFNLVTPTQAEKVFKDAPKVWDKLTGFVTQKDGAPTLVPAGHKKPALTSVNAADVFCTENDDGEN